MEDHLDHKGIVDANQGSSGAGVPLSQIAREMSIDRETARKLRDADSEPTVTVRRRPSKLDQHEAYVRDRLSAGVPVAQIARDLTRLGTPVRYGTLRDFARKVRPEKPPAANEIRFETSPRKQAQCDWSDFGAVNDNGLTVPLHVFVMVLRWSRKTFAKFATQMDELTLQMHAAAFRFFGGVPQHVLYDNMRTVTVGRDGNNAPSCNASSPTSLRCTDSACAARSHIVPRPKARSSG